MSAQRTTAEGIPYAPEGAQCAVCGATDTISTRVTGTVRGCPGETRVYFLCRKPQKCMEQAFIPGDADGGLELRGEVTDWTELQEVEPTLPGPQLTLEEEGAE